MAINQRTNKNYRSESTCTFCAQTGHTIASCPTIEGEAQTGRSKPFKDRTFKENYAIQYLDRKAKTTKNRKTSTKKCGYCRKAGCSRRNCASLKADRAKLVRLNKIWRECYAIESKKRGFAPASLIKFTAQEYSWPNGGYETIENLYLIGAELPDNLSVFALSSEYNMRQDIHIPAVGRDQPLSPQAFFNGSSASGALFASRYWYHDRVKVEVVKESSYEFSEEWLSGESEDIDYILKKWSQEKVNEVIFSEITKNLIPYVQEHHPYRLNQCH